MPVITIEMSTFLTHPHTPCECLRKQGGMYGRIQMLCPYHFRHLLPCVIRPDGSALLSGELSIEVEDEAMSRLKRSGFAGIRTIEVHHPLSISMLFHHPYSSFSSQLSTHYPHLHSPLLPSTVVHHPPVLAAVPSPLIIHTHQVLATMSTSPSDHACMLTAMASLWCCGFRALTFRTWNHSTRWPCE